MVRHVTRPCLCHLLTYIQDYHASMSESGGAGDMFSSLGGHFNEAAYDESFHPTDLDSFYDQQDDFAAYQMVTTAPQASLPKRFNRFSRTRPRSNGPTCLVLGLPTINPPFRNPTTK
jgi:hypothetical protein